MADRVGSIYRGYVVHRAPKAVIGALLGLIGRRMLLGGIITFGEGNPLVQFLFVHFSSLFLIALIGLLRPLETRSAHRIELGSEFLILVLFCQFLCHTNLVSNMDVRYYIGWSIVAIISASIFFNFGNVLRHSIAEIMRKIKICSYKARLRKRNQELSKRQENYQHR